tara:strand:- start:513 stop:632 length:120 start_codon:yes stop_codon:yes gene_type:complete
MWIDLHPAGRRIKKLQKLLKRHGRELVRPDNEKGVLVEN